MVYIPYPRLDLDTHIDLEVWRNKNPKKKNDWKMLKKYLDDSGRLKLAVHPMSKCWYSELPQGDKYALDVEHFRPKRTANAIISKHIRAIEKLAGIVFEQENTNGNYRWLEFDYRNYRIVTACTNRSGAKHSYFPIAKGTSRLMLAKFPWGSNNLEYPLLLDPTDRHDAQLLFVKPNGEIAPLAPKTLLTSQDCSDLPSSWRLDGFNYLRAFTTIVLYNLNDPIFVAGRREVYEETTQTISWFTKIVDAEVMPILKDVCSEMLEKIGLSCFPSAPFALAARCALKAFVVPSNTSAQTKELVDGMITKLLDKIDNAVNGQMIDWTKD